MKILRISTIACIVSLLGGGTAYADACSGRDHTAGTVVGAVGGAAIGGAVSHDAGGAVAGAVIGGLAGNAISRSQDCDRSDYRSGRSYGGAGYYQPGYAPDENDYWTVESYDDFNNDYRHISEQISRGRDEGSISRYDADRYFRQLQRIRQRADWQQRSGRFDSDDIERQLTDLRRTVRFARREGDRGDYYGR